MSTPSPTPADTSPRWHLALAFVPILVLVGLLALDIAIFGSDSILGPSQISLLAATGVCVALGIWVYKIPFSDFEKGFSKNVGDVTSAILILLLIGAISGTWTVSGVVPTIIYYGVKIISPRFFLLTACVICAVVSLMTGSSWSTIATIGVALMGIGQAEGFSAGLTAGAIISGAYFGDKMSPLSDTTVLASSVNGVPLFTHIRYMMVTTVPSITISVAVFTILGLSRGGGEPGLAQTYCDALDGTFRITPWVLVVPVLTGVMIARKMPATTVLFLSTILAAVVAVIFQRDLLLEVGGRIVNGGPQAKVLFAGCVESIYNSVQITTGTEAVDQLVSTRGMIGMLNTIFLILCAMCFGGSLRASTMLGRITKAASGLGRTRGGLVGATVATGTLLNGLVCDQYLSIILTSDTYRDLYKRKGFEGRLASRSVEDSATVTSVLFPWSSCGMTQATILNVPTIAYLPYCFFNILSPLMSIAVALIGYKIFRTAPETADALPEPSAGTSPSEG